LFGDLLLQNGKISSGFVLSCLVFVWAEGFVCEILIFVAFALARFAEEYARNLGSPLQNVEERLSHLSLAEPRRKKLKASVRGDGRVGAYSEGELEIDEISKIISATLMLMKGISPHSYSRWDVKEFLKIKSASSGRIRWYLFDL
jgi:hypothetical protein